jgi:hypothetical protein
LADKFGMSLREDIIHLFKKLNVEKTNRVALAEDLCDVLNKHLKHPLTIQEVYVCIDKLNPTIDHFLKILIGRTGMIDLARGVEIGHLVKREFPHFFTEHASYKKVGTC